MLGVAICQTSRAVSREGVERSPEFSVTILSRLSGGIQRGKGLRKPNLNGPPPIRGGFSIAFRTGAVKVCCFFIRVFT
jgi:hypothetical protein